MNEMIERVARAIFEQEYPNGEVDEYRWERSSDAYIAQARAAIMAMREPSERMVSFAWDVHNQHYGQTEETPTLVGIGAIYSAMIEAAFSDD
jgi:hypothetical protein